MQSAAKLCRESNAAYQISPKPILDTNEYAKKEVGGRGGAYNIYIYIYIGMDSKGTVGNLYTKRAWIR